MRKPLLVTLSFMVATAPIVAAETYQEKKGQAARKAKATGHGQSEGGGATNEFAVTDKYVNKWIKMPELSGRAVRSEEMLTLVSERGTASVIIFLASWCLPCQQIIMKIRELEKKFEVRHTRFLYVFAHDTADDALGFSNLYKLGSNSVVANHKILDDFHQPELPTIYVGFESDNGAEHGGSIRDRNPSV